MVMGMASKTIRHWLACAAALLMGAGFSVAAGAMTLEVKANQIFATGPVDDDVRKFEDALNIPGVDTVVFVNSPGGDLRTGMVVGRMIAAKGVNTVIAGYCVSACSIMFMGGKERRFSSEFRPALTYIGIHGAHDKTTRQVSPTMQPQIYAFYKTAMGDKFDAALMNQALYQMDDAGALLVLLDPTRSPSAGAVHCRAAQTPKQLCSKFPLVDALSLGIITAKDLVSLTLPEAFKTIPAVLGRALNTPMDGVAAYLQDFSDRQCATDRCKLAVSNWAQAKEHKALASRAGARGMGTAVNRDSLANAIGAAVYFCNHIQGLLPALCEPEIVNGFDLRSFYPEFAKLHTDALALIKLPADATYANEEYGGGFTSAHGLRTDTYSDITPQTLPGITTVRTRELAQMLRSGKPPVVVDVLGGSHAAIPSAQGFIRAGLAFADTRIEAAFETRFNDMLKLLAPDMAQPLVLYCAGRNCWHSVNAALRAQKLGYTAIYWYRGGLESWQAAQLPTAPFMFRAVAH